MVSLKIKNGTKREVKRGTVEIEGGCVVLRGSNSASGDTKMIFAHCLLPGETVAKGEGDDYIVDF